MKTSKSILAENVFWKNETNKYLDFKKKHPQKDYNYYYPEKTYPAYLTAQTIYHLLKKSKYPRVLEAGCGLGISLFYLGNKNVECLGIDYSRDALRFAKMLKNSFMNKSNLHYVKYKKANFLKLKISRRYDLVFNSGVLEHFKPDGQKLFLRKMKSISKEYIIIMIPNANSLVFKNFIQKMRRQKREYYLKHQRIDIVELFKENDIKLIRKTGRNLWLQNYNPRNTNLSQIYRKYFVSFVNNGRIQIDEETVKKLALIEQKIPDNILYQYAFTRVYIGKTTHNRT